MLGFCGSSIDLTVATKGSSVFTGRDLISSILGQHRLVPVASQCSSYNVSLL